MEPLNISLETVVTRLKKGRAAYVALDVPGTAAGHKLHVYLLPLLYMPEGLRPLEIEQAVLVIPLQWVSFCVSAAEFVWFEDVLRSVGSTLEADTLTEFLNLILPQIRPEADSGSERRVVPV